MGQISILPQGTALPRIDRRVPLTVHRTPPNERSRETDSLGTVSCDRSLGGVRCTVSGTRRSIWGSTVLGGVIDIWHMLDAFRHRQHSVDASPPLHHRSVCAVYYLVVGTHLGAAILKREISRNLKFCAGRPTGAQISREIHFLKTPPNFEKNFAKLRPR